MKDLFMRLTLADRFTLISILPEKGDYVVMDRVCELRAVLIPTEAEEKKFHIATDEQTGGKKWPRESSLPEVEIPIGETMTDRIREKLEKLSADGQLLLSHVPLYKKFVKAQPEKSVEKAEPEST